MSEKLENSTRNIFIRLVDEESFLIHSIEDVCFYIENLCLIGRFDIARKNIEKITKNQNRDGTFEVYFNGKKIHSPPEFILRALAIYMKYSQDKSRIKAYLRIIRRSFDYIKKHFDQDYLLYYTYDKNSKKNFSLKSNTYLLSSLADLSDTLNTHEFIREADEIFIIRNKMGLGFQRYFFFPQIKKAINKFNLEDKKYEIASIGDLLVVSKLYSISNDFDKYLTSRIKKELKSITNVRDLALALSHLKKVKDNTFNLKMKQYEKYLGLYPETLYKESDYSSIIEKSLFRHYEEPKIKFFSKDKLVAVNLNNKTSLLFILDIFNNG